jgi:kinesin family member C2/C3
VNYRALASLFEEAANRSAEWSYDFQVSMLEIYNETVQDLLDDEGSGKGGLEIRQAPGGGVFVQDLTQVSVSSLDEVVSVMVKGYKNRAVGSHNVNEHSSRSHLVLGVEVTR